jgi:hypothetical protein
VVASRIQQFDTVIDRVQPALAVLCILSHNYILFAVRGT